MFSIESTHSIGEEARESGRNESHAYHVFCPGLALLKRICQDFGSAQDIPCVRHRRFAILSDAQSLSFALEEGDAEFFLQIP